ncbi:MAG: hypothetical protein HC880_06830 [Bacteroidia bacterium]|nr:hypothetical protein [Bacteroidia bacterium]
MAFYANLDNFLNYIHYIFLLVLLHNGLAYGLGFGLGKVLNLSLTDTRTIAMETGIQNSGLGLILIFNFFDGVGGMMLITAWWGVWDMISGMALAGFWGRKIKPASP